MAVKVEDKHQEWVSWFEVEEKKENEKFKGLYWVSYTRDST